MVSAANSDEEPAKAGKTARFASVPWIRIGAESAAIVASILIAFAIDSWWADRTQSIARDELIAAMIEEFEETIAQADSTLTDLDSDIESIQSYRRLIDEGANASPEELRPLLTPAFRSVSFRRSVATYDSAISSGAIGLIDSRAFTMAMSHFTEALEWYRLHETLWIQNFYFGRNYELQEKYGDLRVLLVDPETFASAYQLDETALRTAYADKLVYAQSHTALSSKRIKRIRLKELKRALQEAIEALNALD